MGIIGRREEQLKLEDCLSSGRPELMVLYGRRRVGKTFLIREYFNHNFAFYATGVENEKTRAQLSAFNEALNQYGDSGNSPKNWFEAFRRMRMLLEDPNVRRDTASGRRVVFLDEVPWMDTARSDFKTALEYFWNSWGSAQNDLLVIICGSATSWIIKNMLSSTGGFYNRVTRQISLPPLTLKECEALLTLNGIEIDRMQIMECYMVFGGIPFYLNCLSRRLSLTQNVDGLLFRDNGQLRYEYDRLFRSLYKHPGKHMAIVEKLAEKRNGMTRAELAAIPSIGDGEPLTTALEELQQCGFIRKYQDFTKKKTGHFFQVTDPFVLFNLNVIRHGTITSWQAYENSPGYFSWRGNAFETLCLNHVQQMRFALGISGVETRECAWRSGNSKPGAQIDLLIDRDDRVINICEMKFTKDAYAIDADYQKQLANKMDAFRTETGSEKSLHLTMVTANGLKANKYSGVVHNVITADDLFAI